MAAASSWQTLSPAILAHIVGRLPLPDRARFASVCSSFRSAAADVVSTPLPPQLPYLFLYSPSSFLDLSDLRTYPTPVPTPADRFLLASSANGLLLTVSTSHHLHLLHPFTRSHFPLPPLFPPPSSSLSLVELLMVYSKATVSWRAPSSFAIVMIVNSGLLLARLVLLRDGDPCWRFLGSENDDDDDDDDDGNCVLYYDLAVFKNSVVVVALRFDGKVDMWDLRGRNPMARVTVGDDVAMNSMELLMVQRYLVVAERGELLLQVWRWVDDSRFRVFRMDSGKGKWVEVADLGSQILFLGRYGSLAVDASDFENLKKNCIYYCHVEEEERWKCSVYRLGERNERRRRWSYKPQRDVRPPLWVMPSLE